ncbi:DNA internalization-related competence protein ComEC/Rec2 [Halomonas sp. HNIBRBA4712]|uniref:DNA internalization-related competence protein ComEC/Rec2 n=1 Tax=Halomonas sp. HNIBRBA4712 TaxID=3373087 RepID=UPI0037450725
MAIPAALAALAGGLLAFVSGAEGYLLQALSVMLVAALLLAARNPGALGALAIGAFVLLAIHTEWQRVLPAGLGGEDLIVTGRVVDAQPLGSAQRLMFDVTRCESPPERLSCQALGRVRVTAYGEAHYQAGERWTLTLRLRPPRGFSNPGTFDYGQWLWREGVHATGYVRQQPAPVRVSEARSRIRGWALEYLDSLSLEARTQRWLAALTLGDSRQLTQEDWSLLNATGTTHLVVISGLHVGLIASLVLLVSRLLARLITPSNWRLRSWPWVAAGVGCIGYALLAGMGPPAMRAMVMTLLGLWVLSGRHAPGAWQAWWLALLLVILLDPLALWRPGLWLSFLAVAWLIVIWQGRSRPSGLKGWCWALVRTQLLLAPLMAAAVLIAFGRVAPGAPLVNLIAVPLVSSVMVPLALLGWLTAPLFGVGELVWRAFEGTLYLFHALLNVTFGTLPLWEPTAGLKWPLAAALGLLALCWGLAFVPRWLRVASLGVALALPLAYQPRPIPPGALRVSVFDVGQGQLIELESATERLLYDTGPRFRSGFMPLDTLWAPGQRFDRVIVSHGDTDHAGGVEALLADHRVDRWLAPQDETLATAFAPCARGQRWTRDGIDYRVLWPPPGASALTPNERSCVLEARVGEHRLLITGDAGRDSERRFLNDLDEPVSVLVAGHHGSRTSSGVQFVRRARPEHVIFSAGRDNSFNHPADEVVRRFRGIQSCLWSTAHDGALRVTLTPGQPVEVTPHRRRIGAPKRCRYAAP